VQIASTRSDSWRRGSIEALFYLSVFIPCTFLRLRD
jgi:hypothetical protein